MMKLRKALSAIVLGAGCAAAFIGLLALLLPAIANDQLRLVLSSFEMPSQNPVVNAMNGCMSFALHHAWQVLLTGLITAVIGGILFSLFLKEPPRKTRQDLYRRPPTAPKPQPPVREPEETSEPNPFADLALWDRCAQPREEPLFEKRSPIFNPTPILEPNRIGEDEPPAYAFQPDPEPFMPKPRTPASFETERQAIETQLTQPSQSGSRAILRSTFETPAPEPEPVPEPVPVQAAAPIMPAPEDPYADDPRFEPNEEEPPPPPPVSSRIRSTMGKHS